jgi:hypothetical protein
MNSLFAEFRDRAEFLLVYVAEAHAEDEWPISSGRYTADGCPVNLKQPRSAEERIAAAEAFQRAHGIELPILVDPPQPGTDGAFEAAYAPWPLRFYGFEAAATAEGEQWRLGYVATPEQCEYSLADLRAWLMRALAAEE